MCVGGGKGIARETKGMRNRCVARLQERGVSSGAGRGGGPIGEKG